MKKEVAGKIKSASTKTQKKIFKSAKVIHNGQVRSAGAIIYYLDGILHRQDGPAIEWEDGSFQWYKNGFLHRENGPAVTSGKNQYWYFNGKRHRLDGPAVIFENGLVEYWVDGCQISESEFKKA